MRSEAAAADTLRVIKLADAVMTQPRRRRILNADVVIDHTGRVIKDRYGTTGRAATDAELRAAVDG